MWEVYLDAMLDCLKLLPILFLVYLFVDFFVHKKEKQFVNFLIKNRKKGPLYGTLIGALPQCGFAVAMADFFSKKYITIGTLLAVFIASSDEAVVLMLAYPSKYLQLLLLVVINMIVGLLVGYLADFLFKEKKIEPLHQCGHNHAQTGNHHIETCKCCQHTAHEIIDQNFDGLTKTSCQCCSKNIFKSAMFKTIEIIVFIFIVNLILGTIIHFVGEETVQNVLANSSILQPFIATLIGLIPNCFSSVLLVEMYVGGVIKFSAMLAGLCTGAGVGSLILFKKNKNLKQNFLIIGILVVVGIAVGLVGYAFGV